MTLYQLRVSILIQCIYVLHCDYPPGAFVKISSHYIIIISVFVVGIYQELVSYQLRSLYHSIVNYNHYAVI